MTMLTTNMQGFAYADFNPIGLQATIGGFDLVFGLQLRTVTPDPQYWAVLHSGGVEVAAVGGAWKRLGQALPSAPVHIDTTPNGHSSTCEFRLPLTIRHLASLEELRDSGDLQIKFIMFGTGGPVGHAERNDRIHNELYAHVPQSVWVRALNDAKALDVLLLEVPMPFLEQTPEHWESTTALRNAQRLFVAGDFAESVARCRTAIESMTRRIGRSERWTGPVFDTLKEKRQELTKDERELVVEAALFHFTHLGAHPDEVEITRRDAKLALSLTASVLAFRN
ncbi:MAG: hypothetical protein JHD15_08515 [Phenylobacterium sp.]|uniref:hypothetical protein n=1 Tax=Phenylobacterium sp. TaxID=1871053 RepID=UPI001A2A86FA|nr:hypothetical protein [Phenylobacterium sp.]MBJ7410392.1 hypothetical protein [Phenylobacterium sp.]